MQTEISISVTLLTKSLKINNQAGVIELTTDAVLKKSKNSAYLALLADPVVDDAFAAEKLLDRMIDEQKDYLGYLN